MLNTNGVIKKYLKSKEEIIADCKRNKYRYTFSRHDDKSLCGMQIFKKYNDTQIINEVMFPKFGDGHIYSFKKYNTRHSNYTHRCEEDNFSYHEEWFKDIIEDFIKDDDFKI